MDKTEKKERFEVCTGSGCFPIDGPPGDKDRLRDHVKDEWTQELPDEVKDRIKDIVKTETFEEFVSRVCPPCAAYSVVISDIVFPGDAQGPTGPTDMR